MNIKSERGYFTLIEGVILVLIVGVLTAIIWPKVVLLKDMSDCKSGDVEACDRARNRRAQSSSADDTAKATEKAAPEAPWKMIKGKVIKIDLVGDDKKAYNSVLVLDNGTTVSVQTMLPLVEGLTSCVLYSPDRGQQDVATICE